MNIFIDSTLDDLVIGLFNENKQLVDYEIKVKLKEKSEILPSIFNQILKRNSLTINNINNYFINLGPGTFTGSRISLVFCRTICQVNNSNLFTTNTFELISYDKEKNFFFVDARGNSAYMAQAEKGKLLSEIQVVEKKEKNDTVNYQKFFNDFRYIFNEIFELEKDLLKVEPVYIKKPHIGN
ncbi:tRNA (adenosine(37)-N6)-threonylcarbamoyltransferase complex dimerization subunit type 1 TsaB [Mesomycoplasma lagogenitalium]|uniref:tRNA (Adenosine(37)-N6)-threonylcarbamoyltransferase complex dimerization subunit type 1 TsaB n=1 Tax=Mesomycoplasma lagogenitalium TaxID=171286 RepID=A0ABY8LVM0_9BACT|nr:tRNA (adenosine(37)-N6)-threonylcarbamoyltransferase complex dimerization subunit type 1 TsaB [Mesomycoplasma lagogenitalium]WGI36825.1 tRNA (adenosine(37)-N6)-threonylcarbamoyltransferase complex dimerization subunit type 1 TsaB [Mesomycoplasma lagogenitalium]